MHFLVEKNLFKGNSNYRKMCLIPSKQNYTKIPLVTLKTEVEISLPHYARLYFMQYIVVLVCLNDISMTYDKKIA